MGKALIFEGTDDWVNLDTDAFFLKDSFDGRSVSFRFKPASNFFVGPAVTRYEDLVGYWPLNDGSGNTATDMSPTKAEGAVAGAATWSSGKFVGGLNLDGIDDSLSIPVLNLKDVHKEDYSISVWIKPEETVGTITNNAFIARGWDTWIPSNGNDTYFNDVTQGLFLNNQFSGERLWDSEDIHLDNDNEFMNAGIGITHWDWYMSCFISTFVVPETGIYGFRMLRRDDRAVMWMDLNKNGQIEANEKMGGNNNFTVSNLSLTAGDKHIVAFAHGEGGGGSRIEPWIQTPTMSWVKINPADPAQNGFWIVEPTTPDGVFRRGGEGLSLAGNNILQMTHLTTGGPISAVASKVATQGEWRHVVGVFNQSLSKIRIYVDGNASGETEIPFGAEPIDISTGKTWR